MNLFENIYSGKEWLYVIQKGKFFNRVIVEEEGTEDNIDIAKHKETLSKHKNLMLIHTHPNNSAFSVDDDNGDDYKVFFSYKGIEEMLLFCPCGKCYYMRKNADKDYKAEIIKEELYEFRKNIIKEYLVENKLSEYSLEDTNFRKHLEKSTDFLTIVTENVFVKFCQENNLIHYPKEVSPL